MNISTKANTLEIIKKYNNKIVPKFLFFKKKYFLKKKKRLY